MANETCVWTGASGSRYTYHVHPIGWRAAPGQNGNYIYARLDRTDQDGVRWWKPVYIGQGNLADRSDVGSHHKSDLIASRAPWQPISTAIPTSTTTND